MQKTKRFPFTEIENQIIRESVKRIGEDWEAISKKLPGRTPKQCHDRYINYLRDGLKSEPWSLQEDETLLTMYKAIGPKWSKMMGNLPGRSGNDIKNRWHKHLSKKSNQAFNMNNINNNSKSTSNLTNLFEDQDFSIFGVQNVRTSNSLTAVMPQISFKVPETLTKKEESFTKPEPEQLSFQQQINQFTYSNDEPNYGKEKTIFNSNSQSINNDLIFILNANSNNSSTNSTQNSQNNIISPTLTPVRLISKIELFPSYFDSFESNQTFDSTSSSFYADYDIHDAIEELNSNNFEFFSWI